AGPGISLVDLGRDCGRRGEPDRGVQRRERAIVEVREALSELELVLIVWADARPLASQWASDGLADQTGQDRRFGRMERHVGQRVHVRQATDPVTQYRRSRERRLIHL